MGSLISLGVDRMEIDWERIMYLENTPPCSNQKMLHLFHIII